MKTLKLFLSAAFFASLASCACCKKIADDCCKPGTDCSKSDDAKCKGDSCCAPDGHKTKK